MISKRNPFSLESFINMNRSRITNYGCLTSSCIRAPLGARAYTCSPRSKSLSLNIE
jgi:hypothetical protein